MTCTPRTASSTSTSRTARPCCARSSGARPPTGPPRCTAYGCGSTSSRRRSTRSTRCYWPRLAASGSTWPRITSAMTSSTAGRSPARAAGSIPSTTSADCAGWPTGTACSPWSRHCSACPARPRRPCTNASTLCNRWTRPSSATRSASGRSPTPRSAASSPGAATERRPCPACSRTPPPSRSCSHRWRNAPAGPSTSASSCSRPTGSSVRSTSSPPTCPRARPTPSPTIAGSPASNSCATGSPNATTTASCCPRRPGAPKTTTTTPTTPSCSA